MPRATAVVGETKSFDLKSVEGGQVTLRKLTYGQILQRQSLVTMTMVRDAESKQKGVSKTQFDMANFEITQFEFSNCIVDHNLEDENGRKLNLSSPQDFSRLEPKVGQEIDKLISELNGLDKEDEEDEGNSSAASELP